MPNAPLPRPLTIAIDGPAGSGKSTVTKRLAKELGLHYLDTGAMYRCVAILASQAGLGPSDGSGAASLAEECVIEFREPLSPAQEERGVGERGHRPKDEPQRVVLNNEDVTDAIRTPEIGELASALSAHSPVRRALVKKQQAIVAEGGYTLEGRDATTVIAPDADVLVFLTADLRTRARRRFLEFQAMQPDITLEEVERQIAVRDERDSTRGDSPLRVADTAIVIDTSGMGIDQVVARIKALAAKAG